MVQWPIRSQGSPPIQPPHHPIPRIKGVLFVFSPPLAWPRLYQYIRLRPESEGGRRSSSRSNGSNGSSRSGASCRTEDEGCGSGCDPGSGSGRVLGPLPVPGRPAAQPNQRPPAGVSVPEPGRPLLLQEELGVPAILRSERNISENSTSDARDQSLPKQPESLNRRTEKLLSASVHLQASRCSEEEPV